VDVDGLRAVNIYALADGGGLTLIDGGWALDEARNALVDGLSAIGAELGDVRRFLVTHHHRDHYTNAIAVRREYGTPVLLGEGERDALEVITGPAPPGLRRHLALLAKHGAQPVVDTLIGLGQVGDRVLEAIHTPGHTRGHVVFADREAGLLFAGDHVLPHITPSIAFEMDPSPMALRDYLGALRTVRALPDMELLPAHGPVGGRVHARVDELLAHHDHRLTEIADQLSDEGLDAYTASTRIPWTSRRRNFADLDPFNQMLAVCETAVHLELLVHQGRATAHEAEGIRRYRAVGLPA